MAFDFEIRQDSLLPILTATLFAAGQPIPLGSAVSVSLHMASAATGAVKVDALCDVTGDGTTGEVTYEWIDGDTDTAGLFEAEFLIIWGDSKPQAVPSTEEPKLWFFVSRKVA